MLPVIMARMNKSFLIDYMLNPFNRLYVKHKSGNNFSSY